MFFVYTNFLMFLFHRFDVQIYIHMILFHRFCTLEKRQIFYFFDDNKISMSKSMTSCHETCITISAFSDLWMNFSVWKFVIKIRPDWDLTINVIRLYLVAPFMYHFNEKSWKRAFFQFCYFSNDFKMISNKNPLPWRGVMWPKYLRVFTEHKPN